jgi:MFS family permease
MKSVTKWFRPYDLVFLVASLGVMLFYLSQVQPGGFPLDDSWIHQVYGRNLALYNEWSFVPGVPSAASTSPLYTVLLSFGYRLQIPYVLWTHGLGLLALTITAMTAGRMTARLVPGDRRLPWIAGLALIGAWHLIWAAVSGMETMLFSMWTLVLPALAWRELDPADRSGRAGLIRALIFGVAAALATLTRPEGVMLVGMIGLLMLIVRPQGSFAGVIAWGVAAGAAFLIVLAPYLSFNIAQTGGLLPDTAAAKMAETAFLLEQPYLERVGTVAFPLIAGVQVLLIPGMIYFGWHCIRRLASEPQAAFYLLLLIWSLALIALYAARLPVNYQHGRYVMPALPSAILAGVVGCAWLLRDTRSSVPLRVLARAAALSALLGWVYFAVIAGPPVYRSGVNIINQEMVASAAWIKANLPEEELLAIHDIGAVGYFAPRPIRDLAGLVSPEIVPFMLDQEVLWNWMEREGARYLMAFPDQIPGGDMHDPRLCPVFTTMGTASPAAGGPSMTIYRLAWDRQCPA